MYRKTLRETMTVGCYYLYIMPHNRVGRNKRGWNPLTRLPFSPSRNSQTNNMKIPNPLRESSRPLLQHNVMRVQRPATQYCFGSLSNRHKSYESTRSLGRGSALISLFSKRSKHFELYENFYFSSFCQLYLN